MRKKKREEGGKGSRQKERIKAELKGKGKEQRRLGEKQ